MKKVFTRITLTGLLLIIIAQANGQSGCHALFGFNQTANTLTLNFGDSSTSPNTITSWLWHFGDGTTSTLQNPHHTYNHDGTYYVCLTIHDNHGCSNTICHHITVSGSSTCHAGFTFHADSTGNVIQFTNTSTGTGPNTTFTWDFGDGTTSSNENPHHTFPHPGHYTVCLFIHDTTIGCNSHSCHTVYYHHPRHIHHAESVAPSVIRSSPSENAGKLNSFITYPNPFSISTTMQYELTDDAAVNMEIYDMLGNKVLSVVNENQSAGTHIQYINADVLNAGLYIVRTRVDGILFLNKITVSN